MFHVTDTLVIPRHHFRSPPTLAASHIDYQEYASRQVARGRIGALQATLAARGRPLRPPGLFAGHEARRMTLRRSTASERNRPADLASVQRATPASHC